MTKHSWAKGDMRSRAAVCLHALLGVGVAAGLVVAVPQALATSHPTRYAETRAAAPHHVASRRMAAQATAHSAAPKSSKPGKKAAGKSSNHSAKTPGKAKPHKLHQKDEADNDPPVFYRVRKGRAQRAVPQKNIAARSVVREPLPVARKRVSDAQVAEKKTLTSDDFVRAVGGDAEVAAVASAPEVLEHGESHPEDDERLPMSAPKPASAMPTVSALPEAVTPAGKPTLPEKLHSAAVKAETAAKADASSAKQALSGRGRKSSILPDDHEGKQAVIEQAMTPMILPTLYTRRGKLIVPPPMKGSWDVLVHQNVMADSEGLDRIQDDADLDRLRAAHLLVPLTRSASLLVNEELPENRRYARPWAARFATDTARAFYARFRQPLRLNSAVRTVEYQLRLQRVNGNAAAVDGDGASPHLTGQALDFGKRGMSMAQIAWMRGYLAPLMRAGKLDVEEEFQQACFHISVYRSYAPVKAKSAPKMEVARVEPVVVKTRVAKVDDGLR